MSGEGTPIKDASSLSTSGMDSSTFYSINDSGKRNLQKYYHLSKRFVVSKHLFNRTKRTSQWVASSLLCTFNHMILLF